MRHAILTFFVLTVFCVSGLAQKTVIYLPTVNGQEILNSEDVRWIYQTPTGCNVQTGGSGTRIINSTLSFSAIKDSLGRNFGQVTQRYAVGGTINSRPALVSLRHIRNILTKSGVTTIQINDPNQDYGVYETIAQLQEIVGFPIGDGSGVTGGGIITPDTLYIVNDGGGTNPDTIIIDLSSLADGNGIYTGSDTVPFNTVATIDSGIVFQGLQNTAFFNVDMNQGLGGTEYYQSPDSLSMYYYDIGGNNQVVVDQNGVKVEAIGPDKIELDGAVRITDLVTDPATKLVGTDNDGDLSSLVLGTNLSISNDTLNVAGGGADGNGIYSDTGVVANIPDFMIRANSGQTLSLGRVEGATGLDDYYGSIASGRKWYGVWASPNYFTGFTGLQYLEADSSIINGAEVNQTGVTFGATRQKSWKPSVSYHAIDANTDADPNIEGVRIQGSTGNFDFYSYPFPKVSPSAVSGDTSVMAWIGNGWLSSPTFLPYPASTGGVTGSGAANQLALWDGASTLTGNAGFTYRILHRALELGATSVSGDNRGRLIIGGADTVINAASARMFSQVFTNSIRTSNTGQTVGFLASGSPAGMTANTIFASHNNTTIVPYIFQAPTVTIGGGVTGTSQAQVVRINGASGWFSALNVNGLGASNAVVADGSTATAFALRGAGSTSAINLDMQISPTGAGINSTAFRMQSLRTGANGNGIGITFDLNSTTGVKNNRIDSRTIDVTNATYTNAFVFQGVANGAALSEEFRISNNAISVNTQAQPTATIDAKGSGATSATNSLDVANSNDSTILLVRNDRRVGINTTTPDVSLDAGENTDAIKLPSGTTAQRAAVNNSIRYNSDVEGFEARENGVWFRLTSSQAPSIAAGAAAGTGPTVAIGAGSNDLGGTIEITTGTSTTTGTLATITYGDAFDAALSPSVTITPANAKAAEHMLQWHKGTSGNSSFVLTSRVALDASTLYVFTYQVQQ